MLADHCIFSDMNIPLVENCRDRKQDNRTRAKFSERFRSLRIWTNSRLQFELLPQQRTQVAETVKHTFIVIILG